MRGRPALDAPLLAALALTALALAPSLAPTTAPALITWTLGAGLVALLLAAVASSGGVGRRRSP